jgi:hypothetical protein
MQCCWCVGQRAFYRAIGVANHEGGKINKSINLGRLLERLCDFIPDTLANNYHVVSAPLSFEAKRDRGQTYYHIFLHLWHSLA